jgi:glutaredoxin 3
VRRTSRKSKQRGIHGCLLHFYTELKLSRLAGCKSGSEAGGDYLTLYIGAIMSNVIIYTRRGCGYCESAKALLARKGVAYDEVKLDGQADVASALFASTGRRTVPQIFIGETHIGGCDDLYALEYQKALDALLAS